MRLFRKSTNNVVNQIGRKSGVPMYNIGSKLNIGNNLSQRMDEYGSKVPQQLRSDLEKNRRQKININKQYF